MKVSRDLDTTIHLIELTQYDNLYYNTYMRVFPPRINYDEKFAHLNHAPITEAVIDIRIISLPSWNYKEIKKTLEVKLPTYPKIDETREVKYMVNIGGAPPKTEDLGCVGLRLTSYDGCYVAQFNQTGFVISRLKKYEDWQKFCDEAKKLWLIYCELLNPTAVKRIGVRFINNMPANYSSQEFLKFFKDPPKKKQVYDWELQNFLHRDVLHIPGTNYYVNLIRAILSSPTPQESVGTILDIDVFCEQQVNCSWESVSPHLKAMHWAKNKAFFETITSKKLKGLK